MNINQKLDYKDNYNLNWREFLELPDGSLDKDKVMRELADRDFVMDQVSALYERFIDLSKPFYYMEALVPLFEDSYDKNAKEYLKDELVCRGEEELAKEILGDDFDDL